MNYSFIIKLNILNYENVSKYKNWLTSFKISSRIVNKSEEVGSLNKGVLFTGEITRIKKDGSLKVFDRTKIF